MNRFSNHVPPVSPYFLNKPRSQYAMGWNLFLRGRAMNETTNDWQGEGWLAAKRYVYGKEIPVPCPDDYRRVPA